MPPTQLHKASFATLHELNIEKHICGMSTNACIGEIFPRYIINQRARLGAIANHFTKRFSIA